MDLEIFIHGVPNGHKIAGKKDDLLYLQSFYGRTENEDTQFLVEIRNVNGKKYVYYSYLKYNNIIAYDNRGGSYFGISLRFDAYCSDIVNMYRIMDVLYHKYVLGSLLSPVSNGLKYLSPDIPQELFNRIEQILKSLIGSMFKNADFEQDLQHVPIVNVGAIRRLNLLDCTKEMVWSILMQENKIAISPYYPTSKEQRLMADFDKEKSSLIASHNTTIQQIQQEHNAEVYKLQQSLGEAAEAQRLSVRNLQEQFRREKSDYMGEIDRLKLENQKMKSVIQAGIKAFEEYIPKSQPVNPVPSQAYPNTERKRTPRQIPYEEKKNPETPSGDEPVPSSGQLGRIMRKYKKIIRIVIFLVVVAGFLLWACNQLRNINPSKGTENGDSEIQKSDIAQQEILQINTTDQDKNKDTIIKKKKEVQENESKPE